MSEQPDKISGGDTYLIGRHARDSSVVKSGEIHTVCRWRPSTGHPSDSPMTDALIGWIARSSNGMMSPVDVQASLVQGATIHTHFSTFKLEVRP